MAGIVIDLQVTEKQADKALDRLDSTLEKLQDTQDRLIGALKATSDWANRSASGFNKMAQGAQRASTATKSVGQGQRRVAAYYSAIAGTDPHSALRYAQGQLNADPYDAAAIRLRNRAQGVINRQNPANQLATAMARTRFTPGGAGLPLGIDLMKHGSQLFGTGMAGMGGGAVVSGAASIATKLGPAGIAVGGVVAALAAFAAALDQTSKYIVSVGRGMATAGSVQGLGPFTGGDPSGMAHRLQGSIQGGFGAGYASQAGINIVGGPGGDIDYGDKLKRALRFIANSGSFDQARRRAEGLGISESANLYNTSGYIKQNIGKPVQPLSQGDVRAANDFQAALARLGELFQNSIAKRLTPILDDLARKIALVTMVLDNFFTWLDKIYARIADKLGIKQTGESAQERNTKAVDDNTRALHDFRETLGGGPRARGAVPGGLNGQNFGNSKNMRLGAI